MPKDFALRLLPGIALCCGIGAVAYTLQWLEQRLAGEPYLEAIVITILIGVAVRSVWSPGSLWRPGIDFMGTTLLEVAIVLLGASLTASELSAAGGKLFIGIVCLVGISLALSYLVGRVAGLGHRVATLVACGNSICGNSAIVAVGSVIGADKREIACSLAFTAVLGIIVVLILPFSMPLLSLSHAEYGTLAGLTVYAVPQVLAATFPVSPVSAKVGTLVKLTRVVLLGPVAFALSVFTASKSKAGAGLSISRAVPWFLIGFVVLALLRSLNLLPGTLVSACEKLSVTFTLLSMAALGLSVSLSTLRESGARIVAVAAFSISALAVMSYILILVLGI